MLEELLKQNKIYLIAFVCLILCVSLGVRLMQRVLKNPTTVIEASRVMESHEAAKDQDKSFILVHISGTVKNRGVYKLQSGSRVMDAIGLAGGLLKDSDLSSLNLSQTLKDGQKIDVPQAAAISGGSASKGKKVNINSAG
ncbi:MAG: SLBB domain-containing protein, partial [Candidatus Margulisiibacteriota bacterium]